MALAPILEHEILSPINQLIRRKLRICDLCARKHLHKNNHGYYRIAHAVHKSKSGRPVRPYSTSGTLFLFFVQQTCENIATLFTS